MPKIIPDLREKILAEARDLLVFQGYDGLNIRTVAQRCHIAVGTVYRYFPSKEMLSASATLEDWKAMLDGLPAQCRSAADTVCALKAIYNGVKSFSDRYRMSWLQYPIRISEAPKMEQSHQMIVAQIAEIIRPILPDTAEDELPRFLSLLIFDMVNNGIPFEKWDGIIRKLF